MPKPTTFAARVDIKLDDELNLLAKATGQSKSWLINEALSSIVASERPFLAAVYKGEQVLREGRVRAMPLSLQLSSDLSRCCASLI